MFKRIVVISLALCWLSLAACADKPTNEAVTPAPPPAPPTPEPKIVYGQGFSDLERGANDATWRWMGPEGVIRLKNTGRDMVLVLAGTAPTTVFKSASTVKLTLNGAPLGQFAGKAEGVEQRYEIPAAQLGSGPYSELRLSADKSMVPKEVDKKSSDERRLAFSLTKLSWEEK